MGAVTLLLLWVAVSLLAACSQETASPATSIPIPTSPLAAVAQPTPKPELAITPTPTPSPAPTPTATPRHTPTPTPRPETRRKEENRIAFVGLEGQIYTVDPDGSQPRRISPKKGVFTWPTWSPDARRLVFSGIVEDGADDVRISLFVFDAASSRVRELYAAEPGVVGLLAEGVVHYALWSPDSTRVAFIAFTSKGLSLFLDDPTDGVEAALVLDQGPLWMSWSPDSQYLLVHRGADHFLVNTLEEIRVDELDIHAVGYRVPAWKPTGAIATLASGGPGRYTIFSAKVVGDGLDVPQPVTSLHEIGFPLTPAFLWSPSGDLLALAGSTRMISYLGQTILVYRDLALFSESKTAQTLLIQDNVMAYFWSPDGSRLAYVSPSQTADTLCWTVLNVANGERWPLVEFIPSPDQLTMFQFFDQYAYSHSL